MSRACIAYIIKRQICLLLCQVIKFQATKNEELRGLNYLHICHRFYNIILKSSLPGEILLFLLWNLAIVGAVSTEIKVEKCGSPVGCCHINCSNPECWLCFYTPLQGESFAPAPAFCKESRAHTSLSNVCVPMKMTHTCVFAPVLHALRKLFFAP
jgi:hypothetical protein